MFSSRELGIPRTVGCAESDMDDRPDPALTGRADARYLAFLETVTHLRLRFHGYCARMTGSVSDGEDVVQDALFQAYRRLDTYNHNIDVPIGARLRLWRTLKAWKPIFGNGCKPP